MLKCGHSSLQDPLRLFIAQLQFPWLLLDELQEIHLLLIRGIRLDFFILANRFRVEIGDVAEAKPFELNIAFIEENAQLMCMHDFQSNF